MNETKKTLSILTARWPEAFLIIGFYTLGFGAFRLLRSLDSDSTLIDTLYFSAGLFFLSLPIISLILNCGFLRTVHLEGPKKHTPTDLLKTGKHFFWRIFGISLIYSILHYILDTVIFFLIINNFTSIDTIEAGFWGSAKTNPLLYCLSLAITMLILIKLSLFIPALIIALDCRISESFNMLNKCKLSESKELIVLYFLSIAMLFPSVLLKVPNNPETILEYVLRIGMDVTQYFIWLIIAVSAVRFVGSLNLVYDSSRKNLDSEDMIENKTED